MPSNDRKALKRYVIWRTGDAGPSLVPVTIEEAEELAEERGEPWEESHFWPGTKVLGDEFWRFDTEDSDSMTALGKGIALHLRDTEMILVRKF